MSWVHVAASRLRGLVGHGRLDRELDDEVRFHLEMLTEENIKTGMTKDEARHAALRSFGAIEPMKEGYRERRAFALVEATVQDIKSAVRTLRRNPGFTILSAAVLAVAIGVNTAMFSVLNAVLFRPLPYRAPEQLTMVWTERPSQSLREGRSAYWNVEQWRSQSQSFADMAIIDPVSATFTSSVGAEQISTARISPNFFSLLGVELARGRGFTVAEAEQRQRLVLISHRFWLARFAGSPDALGASINVNGQLSRVIGILPEDFQFAPFVADVWEPHTVSADWEANRNARGIGSWFVVGRLRPDATVARAQVEMTAIAHRLDDQMPVSNRNLGVSVVPLSLQLAGPRSRLALWLLTGAVFCVLLIATTNVASLSLTRSAHRAREFAIRSALGATPARIVRQLFAESLTLAVISSVVGLLVAAAGIRFILAVQPGGLARLDEVALDGRVLIGSVVLCLLTAILVGLAPTLTMLRPALSSLGQEGGRSVSAGVATRRVRRTLVVAEFAMAIMLLVGAGLLIRSLSSVENIDPGFRPERVLSMQLASAAFRPSAERAGVYDRMLAEIQSLPGVESAAMIGDFFVGAVAERALTTERNGRTAEHLRFRQDEVSTGFFKTVGAPLLRGRLFSSQDRADSPRVAIVNDVLARHVWPERDPIGERFALGPGDNPASWYTVVGVVGDMRRQGPESEPVAQMFEPLAQNPSRLETVLVRTSVSDPLTMVAPVQAAVRRVDKFAPLYGVTTLETRLGIFLAQRRFQTSILIGFSVLALLMAATGIYGLIHYSVATRTQEIGIRMALGAQVGDIFRMIIGEGLTLALTGLALGLVGALWLGRTASSLLFGVSATDPLTFASVSFLLTAVAAAACYVPARRAMKIAPMLALRQT